MEEEATLMLDSTIVKAYQHGSGVKRGLITRRPDGALERADDNGPYSNGRVR